MCICTLSLQMQSRTCAHPYGYVHMYAFIFTCMPIHAPDHTYETHMQSRTLLHAIFLHTNAHTTPNSHERALTGFFLDRTMCPTGCILSTTVDMAKWMMYHTKLAKVSTTARRCILCATAIFLFQLRPL